MQLTFDLIWSNKSFFDPLNSYLEYKFFQCFGVGFLGIVIIRSSFHGIKVPMYDKRYSIEIRVLV